MGAGSGDGLGDATSTSAAGVSDTSSGRPRATTWGLSLAYGAVAMDAVDRFRAAQGWQTAVSGFVDPRTIDRVWEEMEPGRAEQVRTTLLELSSVRR